MDYETISTPLPKGSYTATPTLDVTGDLTYEAVSTPLPNGKYSAMPVIVVGGGSGGDEVTDTAGLNVTSPSTESISETATTQQVINEENKVKLEELVTATNDLQEEVDLHDVKITALQTQEGILQDQIINMQSDIVTIENKNEAQDLALESIVTTITKGAEASANLGLITISNVAIKVPLNEIKDDKNILDNGNLNIPSTAEIGQSININATLNLSIANPNGLVYFYNVTKATNMGTGFTIQGQRNAGITKTYVVDDVNLSAEDVLELRAIKNGGADFTITVNSVILFSLNATVPGGAIDTDGVTNLATGTLITSGMNQTQVNSTFDTKFTTQQIENNDIYAPKLLPILEEKVQINDINGAQAMYLDGTGTANRIGIKAPGSSTTNFFMAAEENTNRINITPKNESTNIELASHEVDGNYLKLGGMKLYVSPDGLSSKIELPNADISNDDFVPNYGQVKEYVDTAISEIDLGGGSSKIEAGGLVTSRGINNSFSNSNFLPSVASDLIVGGGIKIPINEELFSSYKIIVSNDITGLSSGVNCHARLFNATKNKSLFQTTINVEVSSNVLDFNFLVDDIYCSPGDTLYIQQATLNSGATATFTANNSFKVIKE